MHLSVLHVLEKAPATAAPRARLGAVFSVLLACSEQLRKQQHEPQQGSWPLKPKEMPQMPQMPTQNMAKRCIT